MHYQDRISGELFDDEQANLRRERHDTEALIARLNLNYGDIEDTLDLALEIISDDLHDLYRRADATIRRLLNEAVFKPPLRLRRDHHQRRLRRALRSPTRPARCHTPPAGQQRQGHPPPVLRRQRTRPRPPPGPGPFPRWFE
jgi:hypothetical protein